MPKIDPKLRELHDAPLTVADCDLRFTDFIRPLWGQLWALCRGTPKALARYERCISHKEYDDAQFAWAERVHAARVKFGRAHVVGLPVTPRLIDFLILVEAEQEHRKLKVA